MMYLSKALQLLIMAIIFPSLCIAQGFSDVVPIEPIKADENKLLHKPVLSNLPINPLILSLQTQLKERQSNSNQENTLTINGLVDEIYLLNALNSAEQYLVLVAQAVIKEESVNKGIDDGSSADTLVLLEHAKKLSANISEQQLTQPMFLQLHLLMAKQYAEQGKFDLAYLEKESYLEKYRTYRKNKRIDMIASLEQSFEVKAKKANLVLLEDQNRLKIRRVAEIHQQKDTQQYNFTLIIATAIVFILLFFRQLRIRNKLILLTRTDALTKLSNRSVLFEHGEKMVLNFVKQPQELSVLLLDLDHFKKINDSFGHQVGDEVLKVIAQLVNETMRSRDSFYRLGEDEFVALLPFADTNKAKAIAMRINEKISQHDFSSLMMKGKITVSIGVATMEHNQLTFDDMLHSADLAMYQAKEQGRNSVVCYQNIAAAQERRAF